MQPTRPALPLDSPPGAGVLARIPSFFKMGFWLCVGIGIAVVLRRVIALIRPLNSKAPPDLRTLDAFFQSHAAPTYAHIALAFAFVCLLPFVFWSRTRGTTPVRVGFHSLGAAVGISAFIMAHYAVGGAVETAAVIFYNSLFLASLAVSGVSLSKGQIERSWRWTLRATAISLGIATTRPVMGIFFATARLSHLTPQQFFGPAFWIGFSVNTLAMEIWLRKRAA